jgi:SAM-dependent methyltransferase
MTSNNSQAPQPQYTDNLIPESDDSSSEADSAIGGLSYATSTTSLRSNVYAVVEEFGRTYHGSGKYNLPSDEKERERLELQHMLWIMTIDGALHLAPLHNPGHVLDICTGTGTWALDFATQYPNAKTTGTDLSPIQPTYAPENCTFEIADAEEPWTFSTPFDYIHGRALITCFTDPSSIIAKAYSALAPGGYLELQDGLFPFSFLDPQPPADGPLMRWFANALDASKRSGRPWDNAQHYSRWMAEQGFVDIVEKRYFWPHGMWAKGDKMKKLGVAFQEDMKVAVEAISMKLFTKVLGWSEADVRACIDEVVRCMGEKRVYMYETVIFVYGRKPLTSTN